MPKNINFLKLRQREKIKSKKGIVALRAAAVLYLILIVMLAVTAFYLRERVSLGTAKEKEVAFLNSLAPLRSKEVKLLYIKDRTRDISEIIKRREDVTKEKSEKKANYAKIITSFKEKIPQDVIINTLNVDQSKALLHISSTSLLSIEQAINGLISLGKDKIISELLLDSLSISEDKSQYLVLITASL